MVQLQIVIRCQGDYREVIVGDETGTASVVRALVGWALVTLYNRVGIGQVAVQFPSRLSTLEEDYCIIHIQARCQGERWRRCEEQRVDMLIEATIAPPLIELFGSVTVEVFCDNSTP